MEDENVELKNDELVEESLSDDVEVENIENNETVEKEEKTDTEIDVYKKVEEPKRRTKIIFNIVAVICIALYCIAISPKTLQNDTFYTVTIGEYIYNNGIGDLTEDLYSWHELPYTYPHWLYDLGMFLIYDNFGQEGIYISTTVFSAILGISIYALCLKKSKNRVISFAITMGACYLLKNFIAARAQLVTFILFAWTVYAIESFIETKKKRYIVALLVIPLLIANLHSAVFPFYFVLYLPYIAEYLFAVIEDTDWDFRLYSLFLKLRKKIARKEAKKEKIARRQERLQNARIARKEKREKIRENPYKVRVSKNHIILILIVVMLIAGTTGCINPAGNGAYTYLYKTMKGNTTGSINEHLPLTLVENDEFCIAVIFFLVFLIFTDTKLKFSDLCMLAGITYLSFKSRRQVSMFAIFCGPILASLISQFVEKYDRVNFIKLEKFIGGWFGAIVVVCLFVIWTTNLMKEKIGDDYVSKSSYPVEASDWILENLDIEDLKLYNEYNYGSYLLFRGIPVFIDSRCDLYTPQFNGTYNKETKNYDGRDIFSDAVNIANLGTGYENKFEEYGVTHVILYANSKLASILEKDSNYDEIYSEGNFKIFERLNADE